MGERPQINWAAIASMPCDGDDIPIGPRRNALGTTSLTPPVLANGSPVMTDTLENEATAPVDIRRMLDDMQAFRAAEEAERQRYVEALTETVAGLFERGQTKQALAVVRSLTRVGPFWATRYMPDDRRRS